MVGGDLTKKRLENISVISVWSWVRPVPDVRGGTLFALLPWHQVAISQKSDLDMMPLAQVRFAACTTPFRWAEAIFLVSLSMACFSWVTARAQVLVHQGAAFGWKGLRLRHVVDVASSMSDFSSRTAWSISS